MVRHVLTCYLVLGLSLIIGLSSSQKVVCSVPNNPGKTLYYREKHIDECQTCSCWKTGVASCVSNCPNTSVSAKCPSPSKRPKLVTTFGDRCNCSKLWCQPDPRVDCLPGWNASLSDVGEITCIKQQTGLHTWSAGKQLCGYMMLSLSKQFYGFRITSHLSGIGEVWTGGHFNTEIGKFYWDGTPLLNMNSTNNRLYRWFPKPFPKMGDCVSGKVVNGVMNITTRPCDDKLPVVCQTRGFSLNTLRKVAKCGSGWLGATHLTDVCFKYHSEPHSFGDAEQLCREEGGHLALPLKKSSRHEQFEQIHRRAGVPNDPGMFNGSVADKTYIGMSSRNGGMMWSNGTAVPPSLEQQMANLLTANATNLTAYCYVMLNENLLSNQGFRYEKVPCGELHPFLCEKKPSRMSTVTILEPPSDAVIRTSAFQSRPARAISRQTRLPYSVKCVPAGDYFALTSHVNGLPSQSCQSGDSGKVGADDFGLLTCEAWGYFPFTYVRSKPALIRQFGVRYFVGWLHIPNSKFGENHVLYNWFAGERLFPVEHTWVQQLGKPVHESLQKAYPNTFEIPVIRVALFSNLTGRVGVNFSLTTELKIFKKPGDLSDLLKTLKNAITSAPNSQIDTQSIRLLSAEYCYRTDETVNDLLLTFPVSSAGVISSEQTCPTTGKPVGEWTCAGNFTTGLYWLGKPRAIPCSDISITESLRRLSMITINGSNVESLANKTADLTQNSSKLNSVDIVLVSFIVHRISVWTNISQQVTKNVLQIVNNVMNMNASLIARSQKFFNAASRLTEALDTITSKVHLERNSNFFEVLPNIAVAVYDQGVNSTNKVTGIQLISKEKGDSLEKTLVQPLYNGGANQNISATDLTINVPALAVEPKERETGQKTSFVLYNNWKLFQTYYEVHGSSTKWLTYSKVVSAKINTRRVKFSPNDPLKATFLPVRLAKFPNASIVCGFWDYNIGDFSKEGCWTNGTVNGRHVCTCDHLTNFAILLDIHGTPIDEDNRLALSIISIIGLSLSITGLLCTIITYLVFRKLRKGRSQQTLFNLSLALLLSMIVFLAGVEQTTNRAGCIAVAVLLHYLILVSFAWMVVEGVVQYLRFVKVLGTYIPRFMLKTCLLSWGIPLLFVIIPVAVNPDLYGGKEYCWLSRDLFYYGFMIPICCAIVVNTTFFVLVVRALTCARVTHLQTNQSERKIAILHLYAGVSTLLLLGITWVFGFLAINEARLAFQYIFCVCNSLQGFFIFIFFNLREKQVRNAWRGLFCKNKQRDRPYSVNCETYNSNVRRSSEELSKGKIPINLNPGRW